ncbi:MAG: hypothetical protein PHQ23_02650 [Candidatus Wallbacteria bacterium]|nr:hypothetical protein [Candidatus Wallbacteria bacterium]
MKCFLAILAGAIFLSLCAGCGTKGAGVSGGSTTTNSEKQNFFVLYAPENDSNEILADDLDLSEDAMDEAKYCSTALKSYSCINVDPRFNITCTPGEIVIDLDGDVMFECRSDFFYEACVIHELSANGLVEEVPLLGLFSKLLEYTALFTSNIRKAESYAQKIHEYEETISEYRTKMNNASSSSKRKRYAEKVKKYEEKKAKYEQKLEKVKRNLNKISDKVSD